MMRRWIRRGMMKDDELSQAEQTLSLSRRCGFCRLYPGCRQLCEERGKPVSPQSSPCSVYDPVSPEEYLEQQKAYREANKDYWKAYREANKDYWKAYREANKDRLKEQQRAYYKKKKEAQR